MTLLLVPLAPILAFMAEAYLVSVLVVLPVLHTLAFLYLLPATLLAWMAYGYPALTGPGGAYAATYANWGGWLGAGAIWSGLLFALEVKDRVDRRACTRPAAPADTAAPGAGALTAPSWKDEASWEEGVPLEMMGPFDVWTPGDADVTALPPGPWRRLSPAQLAALRLQAGPAWQVTDWNRDTWVPVAKMAIAWCGTDGRML